MHIQTFPRKPSESLGIFEHKSPILLAWSCNKPFSAPNSDISVYLASLCVGHMNLRLVTHSHSGHVLSILLNTAFSIGTFSCLPITQPPLQLFSSKRLRLDEKQLICPPLFLGSSRVPGAVFSFQGRTQRSGIRALAFGKLLLLTGKWLIRGDVKVHCEEKEFKRRLSSQAECLHYNKWEIHLAPAFLLGYSSILKQKCKDLNVLGCWDLQLKFLCYFIFY